MNNKKDHSRKHKSQTGPSDHLRTKASQAEDVIGPQETTARDNLSIDTPDQVTEGQLRQAQKMEAVGRLAGGVAHDFNNFLAVILLQSELLLRATHEDPIRNRVEEIKKAADRASSLTKQLLAFSRRQVLQPRIINLNHVVSDMGKMLMRIIGEDIIVKTELAPSLGQIKADPGQMEQVLLNLAVNARDAMPQGGKLFIRTDNVISDSETAEKVGAVSSEYVMLSVSDTGCGMEPEIRERIFEPFFTTKEAGKGTGLGLSTVYGIVKQSEGFIWVHSEVGHGTTFKLYFPKVTPWVGGLAVASKEADSPKGSETVLLVEDDELVRMAVRSALEMFGYKVLDASNGDAALRICTQYSRPIHLVLTDVIMPQMNGQEVVRRIRTIHPDISVVYMSGNTDESKLLESVSDKDFRFLQKPFTINELANTIRDTLGSPKVTENEKGDERNQAGEFDDRVEAVGPSPEPSLQSVTDYSAEQGLNDQPGAAKSQIQPFLSAHILVIDDDVAVLTSLQSALENVGFTVLTASSGLQAIEVAPRFRPDILLVDYSMPGMDGIQTIQSLRTITPDAIPIMITGYAELSVATEALRNFVADFLRKPISFVELEQAIINVLSHRDIQIREQRQRDFLSIVTHELRAPLQAPLRYLEYLLSKDQGDLKEDHRVILQRVAEGIKTEVRLINNLLDWQFIGSGRFHMRRSLYSLRSAVQEVVDSFYMQSIDNNVDVIWDPPSDPLLVTIDHGQIKQAVGNILNNSLEHTSAGKKVKIRLFRNKKDVRCVIRDEGTGIPPQYLGRIFDKSFQVPTASTKQGLGVGLYVARGIVRAHGGDIQVKSKLGRGSLFIITLPNSTVL